MGINLPRSVEVRGLWNDIILSPYISHGLQLFHNVEVSDNKKLADYFFEKQQGQYIRTSRDLSEHNVKCMFYELQFKRRFIESEYKKESENFRIEESKTSEDKQDIILPPGIQIYLLPCDWERIFEK